MQFSALSCILNNSWEFFDLANTTRSEYNARKLHIHIGGAAKFITADKNGKQVDANKSYCWWIEAAPLVLMCERDKRLVNTARHNDTNKSF